MTNKTFYSFALYDKDNILQYEKTDFLDYIISKDELKIQIECYYCRNLYKDCRVVITNIEYDFHDESDKPKKIDIITETIEAQARNTLNTLKLLADSTNYPIDTILYLFKNEYDNEIDRLKNYEGRWK